MDKQVERYEQLVDRLDSIFSKTPAFAAFSNEDLRQLVMKELARCTQDIATLDAKQDKPNLKHYPEPQY